MEILSDRYFFMKEESIWNGYHFYADKPYLAKTRIEDGEKIVSFMAENGCMELKEKHSKKLLIVGCLLTHISVHAVKECL